MDNEKKPSHSNSGITKVKGMIILLTIVTILISTLVGITVSRYEDTNKIKETLELGDVYLTSGRSEDAKKTFNEAILLNTKNKDTYVKIKNLYIKANRLDDALYFLKLALFNKAKDSEFKKSIDEIKKSFEITNIELITNENDSFIPPKKVPMKINNEEVNVDVKWAGTRIDTSKSKNITIEGTSEEYERKVLLTVRVLPKILSIKNINASIIQGQEYKLPSKIQATFINGATNDVVVSWEPASLVNNTVGTQSFLGTVAKYEKKVLLTLTVNPKAIIKTVFSGYIQKVYEDGGKRYLQFDEILFLSGSVALETAKKNGADTPHNYYIVNDHKELQTFELSEDATITLVNIFLEPTQDIIKDIPVDYNSFKNYINNNNNLAYKLCKIRIENSVVDMLTGIYTP